MEGKYLQSKAAQASFCANKPIMTDLTKKATEFSDQALFDTKYDDIQEFYFVRDSLSYGIHFFSGKGRILKSRM